MGTSFVFSSITKYTELKEPFPKRLILVNGRILTKIV